MKKEIKIFYSKDWEDYVLLDTGNGEKLERVGNYTFIRPYEDAFWNKTYSKEWLNVDGKFWSSQKGAKAGWKMKEKFNDKFELSYKNIRFFATPTPFRHFGFFGEQAHHWDFIESQIKKETKKRSVKFLNLFGYTGVASLFALRAGAEVTHVDASKQSLSWAKDNQKLSKLEDLPMRIILDDVVKFLERETKRGNKYDAIIMDPPKFGRGPKGEIWKLEEMLPILMFHIKNVISDDPLFVILTSYSTETSSLAIGYILEDTMKEHIGHTEQGELCVLEKSNNRIISLANTAIWSKKED